MVLLLVAASCTPGTTTPSASPRSIAIADLVAQFDYDAGARLDATLGSATSVPGGTQLDLSFPSPRGGLVSGFMIVPAGHRHSRRSSSWVAAMPRRRT